MISYTPLNIYYSSGIQTQSHHLQQHMKDQIALENRQVHMLFGVVTLFFVGYALRMVLNINELHLILTKGADEGKCRVRLPSWIHVSKVYGKSGLLILID